MNKKILLFGIIALLFVACKSKEEKANELIKIELNKTLYDFSSYEPIETIVDSAFTSIYRDSLILSHAYKVQACLELLKEQIAEVDSEISIAEIWSDSYSSYGRKKFNEAREKAQTSLDNAIFYAQKMEEEKTLLKTEIDKFESTFCGYQAKHKFRCKTKGGYFDLADYLYIIDENFGKILSVSRLDDEDFDKIKELIDEVKNEKETKNATEKES